MNKIKAWYKSKTVIFNLFSFLALVMALPTWGQILPLWTVPYMATGVAIINIGLRFVTTQPIGAADAE